MTPLEEQVEKLARRWEKEADEGELLDEVAYALEGAADELRALLPLEVTDGEARTKPYRCADCDQPHGPFNNIGSGQSNKPEVTYRLVCDRCWGPKPAAPVEVTDGKARITDEMVEAGAKGIYEVHTIEPTWEKATGWHKDTIRALSRGCLSAALTQPQTGIEGKPDGTWYDIPDGGGSGQSPSGVADADLEARIEALAKDWETWDGMRHERYISELRALIEPEPYVPGPYAKAFRERVCPVPEFPGIEKEES